MKKAFTMVELMIVVVIVGILSTLAIVNYNSSVEKGRASEARTNLMQIRIAYNNFMMEHRNAPTNGDFGALGFEANEVPSDCENVDFYFSYSFDGERSIASRCLNGQGKNPSGTTPWAITLNHTRGSWTGL